MCKVFIDPRTAITYATYYIQGLYDVLGKKMFVSLHGSFPA